MALKLNEYGERTDFSFKINQKGTEFQQKYGALLDIPYGKTRTYLEQSKILGDVKAIRAVASAKNPLWIVVPCHGFRWLTYGLCWGIIWRKVALEHENPTTQQSLF
jgi:methylated-DNA-[protein]-cysteine S-methyltransferase